MAHGTDKRKQSLYFSGEMLREIQDEATRQDRSLSWIVQHAWRAARARIEKFPGTEEFFSKGVDHAAREGSRAPEPGTADPAAHGAAPSLLTSAGREPGLDR